MSRLREEIARFRDIAASSFRRDKHKARRFVVATTVSTAGVAVVLAVGGGDKAEWQIAVAAGLSLVATVLQAWDGLFDHKGLWLNRGWTLARLDDLSSRICIETEEGRPVRSDLLERWIAEYAEIRRHDRENWKNLSRDM